MSNTARRTTGHPSIIGSYDVEKIDHARDGYLAFVRGRSLFDCPHPLNTDARREWLNGYSEARRDAKGGDK